MATSKRRIPPPDRLPRAIRQSLAAADRLRAVLPIAHHTPELVKRAAAFLEVLETEGDTPAYAAGHARALREALRAIRPGGDGARGR